MSFKPFKLLQEDKNVIIISYYNHIIFVGGGAGIFSSKFHSEDFMLCLFKVAKHSARACWQAEM